jgi:EAL domain-containing protein (putative c-di-GMP-specific phosphodiesterase class I)
VAEETGLINTIGEWVIREACQQGRHWLDFGMPPMSISINISANQLHHGDLYKTIKQILDKTGFPATSLELELTESILMQRENEVLETLSQIRAAGVVLGIDDFGTGYSSLAYLKSFPLDVLKIDRSFVRDIELDQDDRAITATIIAMAHNLGMQVVAEGVETEEQLAFLQAHHCDIYQGYITSQPLPADEFEAFVRNYQATDFVRRSQMSE